MSATPGAEEKRRLLAQLLKQKAARATRFPLSFAQQRLWFLYQFDPASPLYNMPVAFRLHGPLDAGALERALAEIVRRHEVLRTTFSAEDGEPAQVVAPPGPWRLATDDLSALDGAERDAEVRRRAREDALRPFDLAAGPLFRGELLRLGPDEHVLLLCVHHVASDGWSMEVLARELAALYEAFAAGRPSPLPEPPIQYADFTLWQRERLGGPLLERQVEFWKERLAGAPAVLELPTDRPRPAAQSFRGAAATFALDAATTQKLHRLARGGEATLFMTLLAGFQLLLARYAGTEDVVVGTPIAGRTRRETEGLIGLFVNTLALRTDLSGDPTFLELVGRVREMLLEAHAHQELPCEKLVGELRVERSLSHAPVFQVLFSLQGLPRPFRLGGVRAAPLDPVFETAKFDLSLQLQEEGAAISGFLEYAVDLFDPSTAERMLGHLRVLLEAVADDPALPVSRVPLVDAPERRRLLEEWNRTGRAYAPGTVHALIAAQAARTPEAVAVVFEGEALSYAGLDRRAGLLAEELRRRGVGPESRVGIFMERSAGLVVALLGVLRAGGAYVPLDPSYPPERLAYMLADSGVPVLLTQERLLGRVPSYDGEIVCVDAP
ncbi:MAG TPA: condensation domain-containing protein, partial [Longimicrobiaceae bacterium]|nr:condensation domain-containing protein [Longimicrobiaceae bacterium]